MSETVKAPKKFASLRAFVNSHHRTVLQGDIAAMLSISPQSLSAYLAGRPPGRDEALRLSREFDIDLEGLLDPPRDGAVSA